LKHENVFNLSNIHLIRVEKREMDWPGFPSLGNGNFARPTGKRFFFFIFYGKNFLWPKKGILAPKSGNFPLNMTGK